MSGPSWLERARRWLTVAPLLEVLSRWTRRLIGDTNNSEQNGDDPWLTADHQPDRSVRRGLGSGRSPDDGWSAVSCPV